MQAEIKKTSSAGRRHWLNSLETLSVLGAIGGSVASIVSQQMAFSVIPLSLSMGLNLINRRRILASITQTHQSSIAELTHVSTAIKQKQQSTLPIISKLVKVNKESRTHFKQQIQRLTKLENNQKETANTAQTLLERQSQQLSRLESNQNETLNIAQKLQRIEDFNHALATHGYDAIAYYGQSDAHHNLDNLHKAVNDYTQALGVNPKNAEAYYRRGLVRIKLGAQRDGFEDLKKAAKLFFERGNIATYQEIQNICKEELGKLDYPPEIVKSEAVQSEVEQSEIRQIERVTVESLFCNDIS